MKITVFTPTFNRKKLLIRLYNSLLNQTYKNFEWLIVDDGSKDNTKELIDKLIKENKINIRYFYKENGGKHRAINKGIELAKGDLFFIVDSDDFLPNDSLDVIIKNVSKIKNKNIVGVCGLKGYNENNIIGSTFNNENVEIYNYERKKYGISGDKAEVYFTKILKKYRFPEYENEKFLNECIVWNKIAMDGYKLLYFNKIIYYCDYLEDGLTKNIEANLKKSPKGFLEYINQLLSLSDSKIEKIKLISYYYSIMKDVYDIKTIKNQLNISIFKIKFCYLIRLIFKKEK